MYNANNGTISIFYIEMLEQVRKNDRKQNLA
jgi:hypothetical protein